MSEAPLVRRWRGTPPDADPSRRVLVLPGARYPVEMPGLWAPMRALALAGWEVHHATWDLGGASDDTSLTTAWRACDELDGIRLVLGKSVGSLAAGWAFDHDVPGIWLTPLLNSLACVVGLQQARAPFLLMAGARDQTWDEDVAAALAADGPREVVSLGDCDHGLLAGSVSSELVIAQVIADATADFATRLVEHGLA